MYDVLSTFAATFTIKLAIPADPVRPYLLGGAGLHVTHVERRPATTYDWLAPGAEHLRDDDAYLAFHAGMGATVRLPRRAFAVLEGRYAFEKAHMLQQTINMAALRVTGGVGFGF